MIPFSCYFHLDSFVMFPLDCIHDREVQEQNRLGGTFRFRQWTSVYGGKSGEICLEGNYREDYLHDMRLCQHWAKKNRNLITNLIMDYFISKGYVELKQNDWAFESVHNYIGDDNIIRKRVIAAYEGQKCIILLSMRDGVLICISKGHVEWNCSAPHRAGRIEPDFQKYQLERLCQFHAGNLYGMRERRKDESPMMYKSKEEIIRNISEKVSVMNEIESVYNFKVAG